MRWVFLYIGLTLIGAIVGLLALALLAVVVNAPQWELLGSPPSPVLEILGADSWEIWLRADDDTAYRCTAYPALTCTSQHSLQVDHSELVVPCRDTDRQPRSSPGVELHRRHVCAMTVEVTCSITFVILQDGSIWRWMHCPHARIEVGVVLYACYGGIGGLASAIFVSFGPRTRKWASR